MNEKKIKNLNSRENQEQDNAKLSLILSEWEQQKMEKMNKTN